MKKKILDKNINTRDKCDIQISLVSASENYYNLKIQNNNVYKHLTGN